MTDEQFHTNCKRYPDGSGLFHTFQSLLYIHQCHSCPPDTAETLAIMLASSWILANRLSLILVSCTVATPEGKMLMKAANVPIYINQHMTSHSADVRAAASIAVESFSTRPKVKNLKDLRWKLKAKPKNVKSAVEDEDLVPEYMSKQTSDEILLVRTPDGLSLDHEGTTISDTDIYLKNTHIVPAPARKMRREHVAFPHHVSMKMLCRPHRF